jgi:RNA polymerase primary sigma factor
MEFALTTPDRLVEEYWDFAAWHAKRLAARCGVPEYEDDLVGAAVHGLLEAARAYDPGRGASFPTFSRFHIRRRIYECVRKLDGAVHRPDLQRNRLLAAKARRFDACFYAQNGRDASGDEIAEGLGVAVEKIDDAMESLGTRNIPIETTDVWREGWMVPHDNGAAFDAVANDETRILLRRVANDVLTEFDERTADILRRRHCTDGEPMTLEELSDKYEITRERVRQIEGAAMPRFLRALRKRMGNAA